jgi:ABC-type proline/glycine betaine transport system permease subunit
MTHVLIIVLQAVAATAAIAIGITFLRFWRRTADTLFALFAAAFALLSISWFLLALFSPTEEARPYVYGLRLVAFLLIITAVVQKNREAPEA